MNVNIDLKGMCHEYMSQHGNAKNADIKRLSKFCNTTLVKERWVVILIAVTLYSYHFISKEKRLNEQHENEERRKEEIHQAQLKRLEKED